MGFFKSVLITLVSILLLALVIPSVTFTSWTTLLVASIVLTLLQKIVRPILKILFLPINIVTLGLFSWVINVFILWLATFIVPGFHVSNLVIGSIHLGSIFSLWLISFAMSLLQSVIDLVI